MASTRTTRQLFFPLRTSVEFFPDSVNLEGVVRAKEAVVLYDRVIFEAGLFEIGITEIGSFANWKDPATLSMDEIERSRELPPEGSTMSVSIGPQPSVDVPAAPEDMRTVFESKISNSFVAEWHTGAIEEIGLLDPTPDWSFYTVLPDQSETIQALSKPIAKVSRAIKDATTDLDMHPTIKAFAADALARDAVVAASLDAAFSVTSLFAPLLAGLAGNLEPTGQKALEILVPNVAKLPWETMAEYRDHPGSQDAREKLREFEQLAHEADPGDPLEFHVALFQAISEDLFAAITELKGSFAKDLASEAVKTGVSFIPVVGPFLGPGASLAQLVRDGVSERGSWYAALMELRGADDGQ